MDLVNCIRILVVVVAANLAEADIRHSLENCNGVNGEVKVTRTKMRVLRILLRRWILAWTWRGVRLLPVVRLMRL